MSGTYMVDARRWRDGWELHIAGEGVTQVHALDRADKQVRHWLETMHARDFSDAVIEVAIHD